MTGTLNKGKESVLESLMDRLNRMNDPTAVGPAPFPGLAGTSTALELRLKTLEKENERLRKEIETWPSRLPTVGDILAEAPKIDLPILEIPDLQLETMPPVPAESAPEALPISEEPVPTLEVEVNPEGPVGETTPAPFPEDTSNVEEHEPLLDQKAIDDVIADLQTVVDEFNEKLGLWYKSTGCVANFSWDYAEYKLLSVTGVDMILFRRQPPSGTTVREILERGSPRS